MDAPLPTIEAAPEPDTAVVSFVLRFVGEAPLTPAAASSPSATSPITRWRGSVRHVQSNTERHFTHWDEALAFMAEHVALSPAKP